jgi:hypothetical protein
MFCRLSNIMLVAVASVAFLVASPAAAHDITAKQAWSRATPKGAKVAGGYLTIENRGVQPDRLLSASSGAAAKVEIHQMSMQDDIMTMRPLDDGLAYLAATMGHRGCAPTRNGAISATGPVFARRQDPFPSGMIGIDREVGCR